MMRRLWYEARVAFGLTSLLPLLLLPAYAALQGLFWAQDVARPKLETLIQAMELLLPLCAGLAAAHLMVVEREERFAELRSTYPEWPWLLPLLRTGGALLLAGVTLGLAALLFRLGYGPYSLADVCGPALAPTLYLTGLSLLVSNLTGSYWLGAGATLCYWLFEVSTHGVHTRWLNLFDRSWPVAGVTYAGNRWLLALLALMLLGLNAWVGSRRRSQ